MKTRLFAALLATLVGCGSSKPAPAPTMPAPAPEAMAPAPAPEAAPDPNRPKPAYGTYGFDAAGMDKSVAPGMSFFQYTDGTWLKNTPIPEDKSNYGQFGILEDKAQELTRGLLEAASGAPGTNGQKLADYYKTFMDEAAIEALGSKPIQGDLAAIAKIKDSNGLVLAFAASARRLNRGAPFLTVVNQDEREPDK
ncbi:MAG TPA: hypothetical protein VFP84_02360, partial [Kofleriaceae bacterium]|nr:hypothetical protein [Kofleriaceae bacterium]